MISALSRAVASEQTDALAALDRERGPIEERRSAERDADILHCQKRHYTLLIAHGIGHVPVGPNRSVRIRSASCPRVDERIGGRFDEPRRAADVHQRTLGRRPRELAQKFHVDAPAIARPFLRPFARERQGDVRAICRETCQFVAIDDVADGARRVEESRADGACVAARCRRIERNGTTPDPPAINRIGPPSAGVHTKYPPMGPRSSSSSPTVRRRTDTAIPRPPRDARR